MKAAWRYFLPRRGTAPIIDDNEIMKATPRPSGRMSRYDLYCWHRANGTLAPFFTEFGR
jgi:hypothetical protein